MCTKIINITLSYKYTLYTKVAYTNYFISSLNTYISKTLVPNFGILFTYLFANKKLYYNNSLSLNKNIDLISIDL